MLCGEEKILLVLVAGEFLLGILGNGFMVLVNGIVWIKNKKLATGELILLFLAICRLGLLCTLIWSSFLLVFNPDELLRSAVKVVDIFWLLTHISSTWFATCLSVFYFLKIAHFSHPLFLWLKWRINQVVCMLQVGPLLFSLSIDLSLLERAYYYLISRGNNTKTSQEFQVSGNQYITIQAIMNFLSLFPFCLSLVSFSFLMLSLWRHTCQMKLHATGSRDPSTEAHVRAVKATLSFLILLVLFILGSLISQWSYSFPNRKLAVAVSIPLMSLYPSGHSLILILYNNKLRQTALKMWWPGKCCLKRSQGDQSLALQVC
ncbi:taste receptor type 2 member 7-like [Dromiciops gliroides]|uniref:taste receptor type 2 member 7-like n=1 Tax=Dromiciops gliroides TaxID=33562 RepID=UPI001CC75DC6|nr:taste receptor type 2 member 7-like [Dromiciops gliroides]